jgi:hypothetical protein
MKILLVLGWIVALAYANPRKIKKINEKFDFGLHLFNCQKRELSMVMMQCLIVLRTL